MYSYLFKSQKEAGRAYQVMLHAVTYELKPMFKHTQTFLVQPLT